MVFTELSKKTKSIQLRHQDVRDYYRGSELFRSLKRCQSVGLRTRFVSPGSKQLLQASCGRRLVIHYKNSALRHIRSLAHGQSSKMMVKYLRLKNRTSKNNPLLPAQEQVLWIQ